MKPSLAIFIMLCLYTVLSGQETSDRISSYSPDQLINSFPASTGQWQGDILYLHGTVVFQDGNPAVGYTVEIWQTDTKGHYDHPRDPGTEKRNPAFQFYGSTRTDSEGRYRFRTTIPGEYTPRPRHFHYKIKQNGTTVLTSQFYFSDDIAKVQNESMVRAVAKNKDALLLQLIEYKDYYFAYGITVLKGGTSRTMTPTPSQAEGPYYPVHDLAEFDNDLLQR